MNLPRGITMKIYTKTGDKGKTSLFSGERVSKANARVEAYGDEDELNSVLGALAARLSEDNPEAYRAVEQVQRDLFCVGGWLATTPDSPAFEDLPELDEGATKRLETEIDGVTVLDWVTAHVDGTAAWEDLVDESVE